MAISRNGVLLTAILALTMTAGGAQAQQQPVPPAVPVHPGIVVPQAPVEFSAPALTRNSGQAARTKEEERRSDEQKALRKADEHKQDLPRDDQRKSDLKKEQLRGDLLKKDMKRADRRGR